MVRLDETCSCGAGFNWDDGTAYSVSMRKAAEEWRTGHVHEMPPPAVVPDPKELAEEVAKALQGGEYRLTREGHLELAVKKGEGDERSDDGG